jgi:hypothetical protein
LFAGGCQQPTDIGGSDGYLLSSTLTLWIASASGTIVKAEGWVAGVGGPRGTSLGSWRNGCDDWLLDLAKRTPIQFLGSLSCGEVKDVGQNEYRYESPTVASFAFPLESGTEPEKRDLGSIQGSEGPRDEAFANWRGACAAALDKAKAEAGERWLTGVCHKPSDVSGSNSYYQYASPATAWLGDLAKIPEPEPPPAEPPPDDNSDLLNSPAGANCQERCVAMMTACDAAPVDQTCDAMCASSPTEAQLACAEATSCDALQDWSLKCLLFQ